MLCDICFEVLTDRSGYQRNESNPGIITIGHHQSIDSLRESSQLPCQLCHSFWSKHSERLLAKLAAQQIESGATRFVIFERDYEDPEGLDILRMESIHDLSFTIYMGLHPISSECSFHSIEVLLIDF